MPELLEVEVYRRLAARTIHRAIEAVDAPDAWFIKGGYDAHELRGALVGGRVSDAIRHGKLLILEISDDERPRLGLRFGMTGRLVLDDDAPIERLEYASGRDDPAWNRFSIEFDDGSVLRVSDPRRLGGVTLDPSEASLGPDAWTLGQRELRGALVGSTAPLKARLLDQSRIAGLGNLLTDEILWRAGLDPARAAGSLDEVEVRRLGRVIRTTLALLFERGGSHTGDLQAQRSRDGICPRDGAPLLRRTIGGRTTYSCPVHQT